MDSLEHQQGKLLTGYVLMKTLLSIYQNSNQKKFHKNYESLSKEI